MPDDFNDFVVFDDKNIISECKDLTIYKQFSKSNPSRDHKTSEIKSNGSRITAGDSRILNSF